MVDRKKQYFWSGYCFRQKLGMMLENKMFQILKLKPYYSFEKWIFTDFYKKIRTFSILCHKKNTIKISTSLDKYFLRYLRQENTK